MRIIAGQARGTRLAVPRVRGVRPTLDRVREALFSILADRMADKEILDLFAGSGALGIEALSRGARHAVFVDRNKACIETIARNVRACGFEARAVLLHGVIPHCLRKLASTTTHGYDLVFIDPPYRTGCDLRIVERLHECALLHRDAMIIIEHDRNTALGAMPSCFVLDRERTYGQVAISMVHYEQKR